jgi:hypothetical protein
MQSGSAGVFYYMRKYNMTPLHSGELPLLNMKLSIVLF